MGGGRPLAYFQSLNMELEFPGYEALRSAFQGRLDRAVEDNATTILQAIGSSFFPPLTGADLANVSSARSATLAEWDRRMETIWTEWHSHPQRLRPLRQSMEDGLLSGFRGLVNELRQRAIGIEQYVWRSRDDARVRDSHADYDDGSSIGTRRPRVAIRARPTIAAVVPNRSYRMSPITSPKPALPTRPRALVPRSKGSLKPDEVSASVSSTQSPTCPARSGQQRASHGSWHARRRTLCPTNNAPNLQNSTGAR